MNWNKIDTCMRTKISASSIAEVVIALSIIALCFGIASLIFIRSMSVTSRFQDLRIQTEIQSDIFQCLYKDLDSIQNLTYESITTFHERDAFNDSLHVIEFKTSDDKVLWKQQVIAYE
jgi:hypothetical protein